MQKRTPEQLKGQIRSYSDKHGLHSQEVLQMYLLERVLERLANSKYVDKFILKGGMLISSIIGVAERTTMDMDTTVVGMSLTEKEVENAIEEILSIDVGDAIDFKFERLSEIREDDDYNNFRAHIIASFGKINAPMKIDITTGDVITPAAVEYHYRTILDNEIISVMAYNLETVLAEKYETIIRRNIGNTRARDFYDLFMLMQCHGSEIDYSTLKKAILRTSQKRESVGLINDWQSILEDMATEPELIHQWEVYQKTNEYAKYVDYKQALDTVSAISERINIFCENYFSIDGEEISLRLIDTFYGNENELPYYWWNIVLKSSKENIGKISLRIGHNYHSYYNGNIGYEIDEEYRGNHYAYKACRMLLPVAKHHGMDHLFMSCDYDNTASIKTIERMGANLADELVPPSDYIFYYDGMVKQRIYKLNVE